LVADGLELVLRTREAWADAAQAQERRPIVDAGLAARERIGEIAEGRLAIGEVSAFEIGIVRAETARAGEDRARQRALEETTLQRLGALVGRPDGSVSLQDTRSLPASCLDVTALIQEARAARPEIRGAELTVEAAAGRVGLSRLEAVGLVAIVVGGAARQRAQAELVRGRARLLAIHQQVEVEVRGGRTHVVEAQGVVAAWEKVVATREEDLRLARAREQVGEEPLLVVLESERLLADARLRLADARAELRKARARLARAVGREPTCGGTP
jgi:cobalt-zinc-cadmium efflux system outer membrane protein